MEEGKSVAVRKEFNAVEFQGEQRETAGSAVAAQATAMVQARYVMAMRNPRVWDQVRQDLVAECKRPSFAANKSAFYKKPIGKGVEGLGIRFVEVALRVMRNVMVESMLVFEDDKKEVHRVSVTDLESNLTYPLDVRVAKTVERSKPMDDGSFISKRKNSYGDDVFTVPATDDDLLNKRGAQISKAIRTLGLRIIPGDLQDEAEEIIKRVRLDEAAKDPGAERHKIADAFAGIGVKATQLVAYLGHSLDTCSPAEIVDLRAVYGAIADGESTWKSVMENLAEQRGDGEKPPEQGKTASGRKKPAAKEKPEAPPATGAEKGQDARSAGAAPPSESAAPAPSAATAKVTVEGAATVGADGTVTLHPPVDASATVTAEQIETLKKKLATFEITVPELCKAFKIDSIKDLKAILFTGALHWIGDPTQEPQ